MESEEGNVEGQKHLRMVHYYYINYKQFVNVVKYRLDQMRRKLEMDEKKVMKSLWCDMVHHKYRDCMFCLSSSELPVRSLLTIGS